MSDPSIGYLLGYWVLDLTGTFQKVDFNKPYWHHSVRCLDKLGSLFSPWWWQVVQTHRQQSSPKNHDASFIKSIRFLYWYALYVLCVLPKHFNLSFNQSTKGKINKLHTHCTSAQLMFWCVDHWWAWSTVSPCLQIWKHHCCLALLRNSSYEEWRSPHTLWRDWHNVITDCNVSHIAFSCYDALCGSCCYFEGSTVRLTTGCQCDFVPSLWTLCLQSCRWWKVWITLITVNLFRCLLSVEIAFTCRLHCIPA